MITVIYRITGCPRKKRGSEEEKFKRLSKKPRREEREINVTNMEGESSPSDNIPILENTEGQNLQQTPTTTTPDTPETSDKPQTRADKTEGSAAHLTISTS